VSVRDVGADQTRAHLRDGRSSGNVGDMTTTTPRSDRLAATARAVVLAYCIALQAFFAAYFTGVSAAPSLADLVGVNFGICAPSGASSDAAPVGDVNGERAACLAHCLGALASATPVAAPAPVRPTFQIVALLDARAGDPLPVGVAIPGALGARAPPTVLL
jgi:hypothetical protein